MLDPGSECRGKIACRLFCFLWEFLALRRQPIERLKKGAAT